MLIDKAELMVTGLCVAPERAHAPCWQESDLAFASCSKFEAIERVPIACFTNSALSLPSSIFEH